MKPYRGPPMTLGAAAVRVRLVVWCRACQHQVEPDRAGMVERYGVETTLLDWAARLVRGQWGATMSVWGRDWGRLGDGKLGSPKSYPAYLM